jgi:nucleoside-triphosphatase THEP1
VSEAVDVRAPEAAPRRRAAPVVIVTGERGSGKTTLATAVVERLRAAGARVGGVLAPGTYRDGRRYSFDVVAIATGERRSLSSRDPLPGWIEERCFWADPQGFALGNSALAAGGADVMVIDEVGPWELAGSGWASRLDGLAQAPVALLLVVRSACLAQVILRWDLEPMAVVDASQTGASERAAELLLAR